jgi:phosphoribosylamine--glycine ligase
MNILIVGNGGREHALAWKLKQSERCINLYIAPGNAGTAECGVNINIGVNEIEILRDFSIKNDIDLLVVGPEQPLVNGITDAFRKDDTAHIGVIGPNAFAAQLEGSKAFAKKFMKKHGIPTAGYLEVNIANITQGFTFLETLHSPYVLKADGLAAGKGVLILNSLEDAKLELKSMLEGKFGEASEVVVIEEFLDGIEFSVFALTDGKDFILLPEAKDYKRIGEGDTGLNTGGMGAVSPVTFVDDIMWEKVINKIVIPTISGIEKENMDYVGFVFFGLISVDGEPMVIEYNCRLGDPETEVIIPRIESDLVELFDDLVSGKISSRFIKISEKSAATVMMVSGGYPENYEKDKKITGIKEVENSIVFHAGTSIDNGEIVTNGGRVLAITSINDSFKKAVKCSLENAEKISFENSYFRKDIGFDL